jgi:hypothetical protein
MTINLAAYEKGTRYTHKATGVFWFYSTGSDPSAPFVLHLYNRRSMKPVASYRFKTEAKRDDWVAKYIENRMKHEGRKAERRAENAATELKLGDILYTCWGYEQTNVEYYRVIERSGAKKVVLRQLRKEYIPTGSMQGNSYPEVTDPIGEPVVRLARRDSVKINDSITAWKWDGKYKSESSYH